MTNIRTPQILLTLLASAAISTASLASSTTSVEFEVDTKSAIGRTFSEKGPQAISIIEKALREKAEVEARPDLAHFTLKIPADNLISTALRKDPEGTLKSLETHLEEEAYLKAHPYYVLLQLYVLKDSLVAQAHAENPLAFLSEVHRAYLEKSLAAHDTEKEYRHVAFKKGSELAKAMQFPTEALLETLERALLENENQTALEGNAAAGQRTAFRELANQSNFKDAFKWLFAELLMTFGESFHFAQMVDLSKWLSNDQKDEAIEAAAQWVYHAKYETNWPQDYVSTPENLKDAFETYFENGQIEEFFTSMDRHQKTLGRMSFMTYFRMMGIHDLNPQKAASLLSREECGPARDLYRTLYYVMNPNDQDARNKLYSVSSSSHRPIMQHIRRVLDGETDTPPYYIYASDTVPALKDTLKLNN